MCVVSAVSDWQHQKWEVPKQFPEWKPNIPTPKLDEFIKNLKTITQEEYNEYQRLKKNAAEIDAKTNQPDCQEAWKKLVDEKIEEYIKQKFGDKD